MLNERNLKTLKESVLRKAEIKQDVTDGYGILADMIFVKTKRRISKERLQMLYERDYPNAWPSIFILETLALFCGFTSLENFLVNHNP